MAPGATSPWRISNARVEISMTPRQFGNGGAAARRAATKIGMKSFLMKYNKGLGGVPMALKGPLTFPDNSIRHIDASPFSHVTAEAKVLLFAPTAGCVLSGEVIHVGADHIGLTVLGEFHAYLELTEFIPGYKHMVNRYVHSWTYTGQKRMSENRPDVQLGTWVQFCVVRVQPTRKGGLFHIVGTVKTDNALELGLGFCRAVPEPVDMQEVNEVEVPAPENTMDDTLHEEDTALFNDELADLINDITDKAPLNMGESDVNEIMTNMEKKLQKKKRRGSMEDGLKRKSGEKRRRKSKLDESPLGEVDLRDEDLAHLRAPSDNSPHGGQNPDILRHSGTSGKTSKSSSGKKMKKRRSKEKTRI